jgi:hypothetical protein
MARWWTEIWTRGTGRTRTYCGIARTPEGFAVDVFHGDTCLESAVYRDRDTASRAAASLRSSYAQVGRRTSSRGDRYALPPPQRRWLRALLGPCGGPGRPAARA